MVPNLPVRHPGAMMPGVVRDAAVRAGRRGRAIDPLVLRRVRDALARLPDIAMSRSCLQVPGDCLASPGLSGPVAVTSKDGTVNAAPYGPAPQGIGRTGRDGAPARRSGTERA
jgi:hypothetical protein